MDGIVSQPGAGPSGRVADPPGGGSRAPIGKIQWLEPVGPNDPPEPSPGTPARRQAGARPGSRPGAGPPMTPAANLELRSATNGDLRHVMRWIPDAAACRRWAGPRIAFPLRYPGVAREIGFAPGNAWSLFEADQLVGFAQLLRRRPGVHHMTRVIVDPRRRGARHGHRLCEELINVARTDGARCISLYVYRDNLRALHLYRSLGWVSHRRVPCYGPPDGLCYMVKFLRTPE